MCVTIPDESGCYVFLLSCRCRQPLHGNACWSTATGVLVKCQLCWSTAACTGRLPPAGARQLFTAHNAKGLGYAISQEEELSTVQVMRGLHQQPDV